MISIPKAFSGSYAEARIKFLEAAATAGIQVQSHIHPLKGRDGEDLAMDVARDGPMDAPNLLIISSACHGAEGFWNGNHVTLLIKKAYKAINTIASSF